MLSITLTVAKATLAEKWSGEVETKKHTPEGLFKNGSAEEIANHLLKMGGGAGKAIQRLSFYRNRAGKNLSKEEESKLNHAEQILKSHEK